MDDVSSIWTDDLMKIVHRTFDLEAAGVKFTVRVSVGVRSASFGVKSNSLETESSGMYI